MKDHLMTQGLWIPVLKVVMKMILVMR